LTAAEYTLDLCDRIAAHTDIPGTITRTFLSPATRAVHTLLRTEMEALAMTVRTDSVGNLRGIYPGALPDAATLLIGSHIDTVPDAGRYDGILGVAAGIALVRSLEGRRLPYAIEVIAFSEEEGVRFKLPFIGSRALIGDLTADDLARTDANGISIAQAIRDFGLDPVDLADALLTPGTFAFFEPHIEQGPVLESLGLPLGIVTTIIGQSRFELTFSGKANHAGTTPMHLRSDALAAAAMLIVSASYLGKTIPNLVATVGSIRVSPGAANVIPGTAVCSLDVRHPSDDMRKGSMEELLKQAGLAAAFHGVTLTTVDRGGQSSVPMDSALQAQLTAAAAEFHPHAMPSGAGHDAMILARELPCGMLFLRTPAGLSHHPDESVSAADVAAAIATSLRFLDSLAYHHPHGEGTRA
jgi:allantoate deiminase